MQKFLGKCGSEVFFKKHLDGIGKGLEQAYKTEAEKICPVGADPVLHHSAFLPFQPGQVESQNKEPHHRHDNLSEND